MGNLAQHDPCILPSAATLFRMRLYDQATADLIQSVRQKLGPLLELRAGGNLKRIQAAQTPEELLELSPLATGLAQDAWHARMRAFGPQALPPIQQVLRCLGALEDQAARQRIAALLIAELRWQGEVGARALLDCLDDLDDSAAALACVALGLLRFSDGVGKIWERYLRLKALSQEDHFIGALWGLIDLRDRRVAGELYDFLLQERWFYELFGFLARGGDERALAPLLSLAVEADQNRAADPLMAATAIAHRAGRTALVQSLLEGSPCSQAEDHQQADEIAAMLLSRPLQEAEAYFALFYRGFQPEEARNALRFIRRSKA
jgi:hypothetical protein